MSKFKKISFSRKGCLLGCLGLLALVTIICATGLYLLNSFFGNPPSKDEIKNTVVENKELFDRSVSIIKKLDKQIYSINHTKYYPAQKNLNVKGLYTSKKVNHEYVETPMENRDLEELFLDVKVEGIDIYENCIEYFFGGIWRDYYCGVVWTFDGKPVGFQDEKMELVQSGIGWEYKEVDGDNWYYTEKIVDNWYFYEMSF